MCISSLYDRFVLRHPKGAISALILVLLVVGSFGRHFALDASSDSLVLEQDPDLRLFREVVGRYSAEEFLLLTYTPEGPLYSDAVLQRLKSLRDELAGLSRVSSVITILDVPLLQNPPVPIKDLKANIKMLLDPATDREAAQAELAASPVFRDLLVSVDGKTTALAVYFTRDAEAGSLLARRTMLVDRQSSEGLNAAEETELQEVRCAYSGVQERHKAQRHGDIVAIRRIMAAYQGDAELFLGGVPMIADDMISFIKSDLRVFGLGMFVFLIVTLGLIFRGKRWVVLPMLCCAASVACMVGLLGMFDWKVTVISSNFVSLQLIMTMALAIHLIVRYRELIRERPVDENRALMLETVRTIFKPCLYTTLTTIAGFSSLMLCDILPVTDFGWMMTAGLCVSLVISFILFPAGMLLLSPVRHVPEESFGKRLTGFFARFTERHGTAILVTSAGIVFLTLVGILRLEVENSFIDYFHESTAIYQGMRFIDEKLGGTTPLDVVIDFPVAEEEAVAEEESAEAEDDEFSEFEDEFEEEENDERYWYTETRMDQIGAAHDYLDALPETGKVLSLHTVVKIALQLTEGEKLDSLGLALLFKQLPEDFRDIVQCPYVSIDDNQARISIRMKDSLPTLRRAAFLQKLRWELPEASGLAPEQIRLSGMMVLYNNMLQSLFRSQIQTAGMTVAALMIMFLVLFRSVSVSLIAIFPNVLASLVVLGVMGLLGIPLDMMTITIVAISIGIAVDNTIHYIHRFKHEFAVDRNYLQAMHRAHGTIGNAMFYTSITIILGFSILALSNFIPSVLFGLLTGLAMAMALLAALALLPRLILMVKPFGPEGGPDNV